jgi:hypothetical protein
MFDERLEDAELRSSQDYFCRTRLDLISFRKERANSSARFRKDAFR